MNKDTENMWFIVMISCTATIGGFLFGFDSGVINGTFDGLALAFKSDAMGAGFNISSMLLGCAVGAFSAARMSDLWGRKTLLLAASVLFLISAWGSGISETSTEFVIYRIIGGLAVGAASVMAPAYISEIAPTRYRGSLTTIQQVAIIVGLFAAFVSNYFLAQFAGSSTAELWLGYQAWRWMFWIELIPASLFFVALFFIPESPRYLAIHNKPERALQILSKISGSVKGKLKLAEIESSLAEDRHRPKISDILHQGKIKKVVWIGLGLATFQQLVGINVVFYYGAVLWQSVGFSESDALLINIISGGVSIAACIITIFYIDKIGRKPFLLIGSIGMTVTLLCLVYAFATSSTDQSGNLDMGGLGSLALVSANAYVFFFNLSWGPVMWVMLGEMFPNQIRGSALAVSGLAQWLTNFLITLSFPIMLTTIGLVGAYGFYAFCGLISIGFVYYFVQETKGKELEEMVG